MFEKRKAHRLEVQREKQAAAKSEQEKRDALGQLEQMARTLPDEDGVVSLEAFQQFFQIVIDHDIALRDHPALRDTILLGLAQGGCSLRPKRPCCSRRTKPRCGTSRPPFSKRSPPASSAPDLRG